MFKQAWNTYVLLIGLMFALCCNERYTYLNKVKTPIKRGTISVRIINQTPSLLNSNFEKEVEEYCIKRLRKEGYNYTTKAAQYELLLEMKVDSTLNFGIQHTLMPLPYREYAYSRISKGIELKMEARYVKTESLVWEDKYDLYFFNNYGRDLYRTKGVLKYMLSGINESD